MKTFTLLLFFLSFLVSSNAQAPINDDCAAAIAVNINPYSTTCTNSISASTLNATPSSATSSCGNAAANDDIWYSFVATSNQAILRFTNATYSGGGAASIGYTLYDGSCASLVETSCDNGFGFVSGYKIMGGLNIGTTYFIKLYGANNTSTLTFNFCIQSVPQPPINDDCASAIVISPNAFSATCTTPIMANTTGATASTPTSTCDNGSGNDDIWYKFIANSTKVIMRYSNLVSTTGDGTVRIGYALYEGSCPSSSTSFYCNNAFGFVSGYEIIPGLTIGTEYYLKVYSQNANNFATFNFCIQSVPEPPVNDECAAAIAITPEAFSATCTNPISANTTGATASTPTSTCDNGSGNDDIWYKFTAASTKIILRYSNLLSTTGDGTVRIGYAIYEGSCPSSPTSFYCNNALGFVSGYEIVAGLTIGSEYYLKIYSQGDNNYASFNFCIQSVPEPPLNDECATAISISPTAFGATCTSSISASTTGATASTPTSTCDNGSGNDDIWYKFTAASTKIILRYSNLVSTTGDGASRIGYAIYEGSCPSSSASFYCNNSLGFFGGYEIVSGLTVGTEYYLKLYSLGNNNFATFDFCIQSVPEPPVNDDCSNAINLTVNAFGTTCTTSINVNTTGAAASTPTSTCDNGSGNDDIWYKFTASSTKIILRYSNFATTTGDGASRLGYAIYEGSCPSSSTSLYCNNSMGFFSGYEIVSGLTAGTEYYLKIYSGGINNYASFDICIQEVPEPPVNDECTNAIFVNTEADNSNCVNSITINTSGATRSALNPSCSSGNNDDLWYTFNAPTPSISLRFSNAVSTITTAGAFQLGYALYTDCPASSTAVSCNSAFGFGSSGLTQINGLTAGNTYTLRLFSSASDGYASFNFCIQSVPAPPINDNCANATTLTVGNGFCTSPSIGNLQYALPSSGIPIATCATAASVNDVWYKIEAPATGNVIIQTSPSLASVTDLFMTAYIGSCAALVEIGCDDNGNPNPFPAANHSRIGLTGRVPGEEIFIRIQGRNTADQNQFSICAWDTTTSVLPAIAAGGACVVNPNKSINAANGNQYMWVPIFDAAGDIVAEFYANGKNVGNVSSQLFVNTNAVRNSNGQFYLDRNLAMQTANTFSGNVKVRIYLKDSEFQALQSADPSYSSVNDLTIIKVEEACNASYTGGGVFVPSTSGTYTNSYYLEADVNSFSSFYFSKVAILPIVIESFDAYQSGEQNSILWKVASSNDVEKIVLERSTDGQRYDAIQTTNGTSSIAFTNRVFTETDTQYEAIFYRLVVYGKDGSKKYSDTKVIRRINIENNIVSIYPNPVSDILYIRTNGSTTGKMQVVIYNSTGKTVMRKVIVNTSTTNQIDVSLLPAGLYILQTINNNNIKSQHKIFKQ